MESRKMHFGLLLPLSAACLFLACCSSETELAESTHAADFVSDTTLKNSDDALSPAIEDWRHAAPDNCEIHGVPMDTVVVPNLAGIIDPTTEYIDEKARLFPHHGIIYGPDFYGERLGKIYVCRKCAEAYQIWSKAASSPKPHN